MKKIAIKQEEEEETYIQTDLCKCHCSAKYLPTSYHSIKKVVE